MTTNYTKRPHGNGKTYAELCRENEDQVKDSEAWEMKNGKLRQVNVVSHIKEPVLNFRNPCWKRAKPPQV
jgi:hypothetical protein